MSSRADKTHHIHGGFCFGSGRVGRSSDADLGVSLNEMLTERKRIMGQQCSSRIVNERV